MTPAQEIATQIGQFFLQECKGDYVATATLVERLRITDIRVNEDEPIVTIKTSRPGLVIGRKGQTIEALATYLGKKLHIEEETNHWLDWLTPRDYDKEFEDELY